MEDEFHELNDLNVEPDPDPEDDDQETSFIEEPFNQLITEVDDLNTRVDKSVEEVKGMQAESERALSDNVRRLNELVQRQRTRNASREEKRRAEIVKLQKEVDRSTKLSGRLFGITGRPKVESFDELVQKEVDRLTKQENIELKKKADDESLNEFVQRQRVESISKEAKRRADAITLQRRKDRLAKKKNTELKEIADKKADDEQAERMKRISKEAKRRAEFILLQRRMDRSAKKKADDDEETSFINKQSGGPFGIAIKPEKDVERGRTLPELQERLDELTKEEVLEKKADDEKVGSLMREITEEEDDNQESFIENGSDDEYKISFIKDDTDDVIISEERNRKIKRSFDHKNTEDFFTNTLDLEPQCSDPEFVDYLIDNGIFDIKRELGVSSPVIDYSVNHLGEYFKSVNRSLNEDDIDLLRDGIRLHYDEWTKRKMNKILKKAGIAAAIGLSVVALTTGLIVGLTRKGADMVHQAKKWEKLTPAKKISGKSMPWTELEKATGKVVIFTGEHILVVMVGVGILVYSK